jgi:hypothetical protein
MSRGCYVHGGSGWFNSVDATIDVVEPLARPWTPLCCDGGVSDHVNGTGQYTCSVFPYAKLVKKVSIRAANNKT